MKKLLPMLIIAFLLLSIPAAADDPSAEQVRINGIEKAIQSTVKLSVISNKNMLNMELAAATGTGFFVGPNKILTAAHVVLAAGVMRIDVTAYDGKTCTGKVGYREEGIDLAIVETDCTGAALRLADSAPLGSDVYMLGNPKSLDWIVTAGIVSRIVREPRQMTIIADINGDHGNSGGPMIDSKGRVVALAEAKNNKDTYLIFGIHADTIKKFLARAGVK